MKAELITDSDLRARWSYRADDPITISADAVLTPCAQEFVRDHHIEIIRRPKYGAMSRSKIPMQNGKPVFVNLETGRECAEKPEEMTHLRGNLLVFKTHPRIAFRGQLDSLLAEILLLQSRAHQDGETALLADLEDLAGFTRRILGAEVKDEPLAEGQVLGMDAAQIRHASHNIKGTLGIEHPIPDYRMPLICLELNRLRTRVREAELDAAHAFEAEDGSCTRVDLVQAMNRLSSCVYLLFCRKLAGYYDRRHAT